MCSRPRGCERWSPQELKSREINECQAAAIQQHRGQGFHPLGEGTEQDCPRLKNFRPPQPSPPLGSGLLLPPAQPALGRPSSGARAAQDRATEWVDLLITPRVSKRQGETKQNWPQASNSRALISYRSTRTVSTWIWERRFAAPPFPSSRWETTRCSTPHSPPQSPHRREHQNIFSGNDSSDLEMLWISLETVVISRNPSRLVFTQLNFSGVAKKSFFE